MHDAYSTSQPATRQSFPFSIFKKAPQLGAAILLFALFLQCAYSAWTLGQTIDETYYNGSGYPIVRCNNYEFLGEHPPLVIGLGALPLLFLQPHFPIQNFIRLPGSNTVDIARTGALFLYKMGNDPQLILFWERFSIIFLTLILGIGIFRLGREIYGEWGALLALFLFAFMPDVIGNGSLYMTDMGLTVFYFFSIYALKRFFDKPTAGRTAATGIACGLAFMSKISSLILVPAVACLFLIYYFTRVDADPFSELSARFQKIVCAITVFLVANAVGERQAMVLFGPFLLLTLYLMGRDMPRLVASSVLSIFFRVLILGGSVLCAVYAWRLKKKYGISIASFALMGTLAFTGFSLWVARWPASDNRSRLMKFFLVIWVFAALVIVLGYTDIVYKFYRFVGFGNYMKPLGIVLSHMAKGHGSYVTGSFIACDWRYFPMVMAVKTPLLALILSGIGALLLLSSRRPALIKGMLFVPVVFFLGAAMAGRINIGLRHILPIYPFLFLMAGFAGAQLANMRVGLLKKMLVAGLSVGLVFLAIRTLRTAPDYLVYFSEGVGNAEQGSKLMPSNWGEDNKSLAEFVLAKKIPSIKIASEMPNADIYDYYKIPWGSIEEGEWSAPRPGFYALGIAIFLAQQNDPRSWFRRNQPRYRVGKTFYIFEVPKEGTIL